MEECLGCKYNILNQLGHMDYPTGCLSIIPVEYDSDDSDDDDNIDKYNGNNIDNDSDDELDEYNDNDDMDDSDNENNNTDECQGCKYGILNQLGHLTCPSGCLHIKNNCNRCIKNNKNNKK